MENSAYAATSAHLNSPALVVFSQAASGLQDVLRIQRPFNHQMSLSEASKDLQHQQQQRFNAASAAFSLRHMEAAYGALPSHILSHLQPQFLHPCLSLGSGAGAFRPLTDFKQLPPPSAFAPPKCLKIETNSESIHSSVSSSGGGTGGSIFSPGEERLMGPSPRTDSCSPGSASLSPQSQTAVKEESLDAQLSEDGGEGGGYRQGDAEGSGSPTPPAPEEHHRAFRCKSHVFISVFVYTFKFA
nr:unnamed protein product [Callosobruchus analis]